MSHRAEAPSLGRDLGAITFDFGNTLVPVTRDGLRSVVERTADAVVGADPAIEREAFLTVWAEERERQFREEVPRFREVDLGERLVRVFARLRGMPPPPPDSRWDQAAAAGRSDADEVSRTIQAYSQAFVDRLPPVPGVGPMLERLAARWPLAILSNWPLAATVDRYADAHGWSRHLAAIVISQRVGTIKPHPAIYAAARDALGSPPADAILHVGDDWAADVAGAQDVGWRAAWIRTRPSDSPLPSSAPDDGHRPDLTLDRVTELEAQLAEAPGRRAAARADAIRRRTATARIRSR